ncbi:MAG: amidase [Phenylobacterium sp.]|uniref:amidase n=1 Tax=Phenylobacterium sp. TaxID=1871053 RepID=UPI00391D8C0B
MLRAWAGAIVMALGAAPAAAQDLAMASAAEQQAALAAGTASSRSLAEAYLRRIGEIDRAGPRLNSVLSLNPDALKDAAARDAERRAGRAKGPLHGLSILVKDNIETADRMPTTAGSLALKDNVTGRDAPLVARLRRAGVVILGKSNLSEWANFRSTRSISGWSGLGGLTRNPHALDRSACGSSSGSGAAVAAGLAWAAIGTETDGSVTCPAAMNGIVGLKPTVGLVSRTHVVPISASQDTAGPMARTVADAALLLTAMAGTDPADPATAEADAHAADFAAGLEPGSLKGARLGVVRYLAGRSPQTEALFDRALEALKSAGAVLVEVELPDETPVDEAERIILGAEFKAGVDAYLATTPPQVKTRSLADLIAFNAAEPRETVLFGQEVFEQAAGAPGLTDPTYLQALDSGRRLAGPEGLDRVLAAAGVEALVAPSGGPASVVDPVNGGRWLGSPSTWPAVAGYPHLTVPMGAVSGLPVGLSFIGPKWSDGRLLSLGYAFEQATQARVTPSFAPSISLRPEIAAAYAPKD